MNDKLNEFVKNMGVLCETWYVSYSNFIKMGLDHKAALDHTKGFMAAFMESFGKNGGGEKPNA